MAQTGPSAHGVDGKLPSWVPTPALHYLAHTEAGLPIRELARGAGCHASTVLRQIRSFETRREDPLVDAALCRLGRTVRPGPAGSSAKETRMGPALAQGMQDDTISDTRLRKEAARILRRLCESGALLVVASNMDKAVVLRDRDGQEPTRIGVVDKEVAEAMALKGWIQCGQAGRIARYTISAAGRDILARLMAEVENSAMGFAEAPSHFQACRAKPEAAGETRRRRRYTGSDSPLVVLARRKTQDGAPFLADHLVRAGERLREDFELAQMEPGKPQDWEHYLSDAGRADAADLPADTEAQRRVARALRDLGAGLGDVVLRCCCYLEGLELAEKRMGWSARSGKVVLRIALQRLHRHYEELGEDAQLIG